eukprot:gnl/Ergobibamus_cyprinoides/2942.p1 GENE.gnl/Ergobibamus_cyprinoides/2942~~gnl/Ergobibamus_cyprinoides/2942.p1  ORF type:complete len:145 (+),score=68.60 gnl/Ergobibamus_cyprinoides/2942:29-436(+)
MIDASHHSYEENIAITKKVVEYAHARGVSVEAELGTLGGIEEDVTGTVCLTDPAQAKDFVARTGIDALAIAIGTSHGSVKFKGTPKLAIDLVAECRDATGVPLVLHGASSVFQETREEINRLGGAMPEALAVPPI